MSNKTQVGVSSPKRSTINLSNEHVSTTNFGRLTPVFWKEVLPNESFNLSTSGIVRLNPMSAPTFGSIDCYVHNFFVPLRLLMPDFKLFYTGENPTLHIPQCPIDALRWLWKSYSGNPDDQKSFMDLWTNLGLPSFDVSTATEAPDVIDNSLPISMLPFMAYQRIWWDYFRDTEHLPESSRSTYLKTWNGLKRGQDSDFASVLPELMETRYRTWRKDYLTESYKDLLSDGSTGNPFVDTNIKFEGGGPVPSSSSLFSTRLHAGFTGTPSPTSSTYTFTRDNQNYTTANIYGRLVSYTNIQSLLSPIRDFFYRLRKQVSGDKYIDMVNAEFGSRPQAEVLDYVQFIGGKKFPISFSDVTSTAEISGGGLLGDVTGKGIGVTGDNDSTTYHASEHGIIMSILSIMPETGYAQGVPNDFLRNAPEDFFHPDLENMTMVAIPKSEVYVNPKAAIGNPDAVFSFTQPYWDYRRQKNVLGGDFATDLLKTNPTLSAWHLFRVFSGSSAPNFDVNFNTMSNETGLDRIFDTNNTGDPFYFHLQNKVIANRVMSSFALPTLESIVGGHMIEQHGQSL